MRLYTTTPVVARELSEDMTLGGHFLPKISECLLSFQNPIISATYTKGYLINICYDILTIARDLTIVRGFSSPVDFVCLMLIIKIYIHFNIEVTLNLFP